MDIRPWWQALRRRLGGQAAQPSALRLQPLGMGEGELRRLRGMVDELGRRLGVPLALDPSQGDIVVVDSTFAESVPPQALAAMTRQRPVVAVHDAASASGSAAAMARAHAALLRQLRSIDLIRRRMPEGDAQAAAWPESSSFDSGFDSRLQADELVAPPMPEPVRLVVRMLLIGRGDTSSPPLGLAFADGSMLRVDFGAGWAQMDPGALTQLRVHRRVPLLRTDARPGDEAIALELDQLLWDLGLACSGWRLLGEPEDWWHATLQPAPVLLAMLASYTRLPRHLVLARCVAGARRTPSDLRRQAQVSVRQLREFLQPALFLGLLRWPAARRATVVAAH